MYKTIQAIVKTIQVIVKIKCILSTRLNQAKLPIKQSSPLFPILKIEKLQRTELSSTSDCPISRKHYQIILSNKIDLTILRNSSWYSSNLFWLWINFLAKHIIMSSSTENSPTRKKVKQYKFNPSNPRAYELLTNR